MESKNYNTIDIIKFLYFNKKPIIIITTAAAIISIIVSLLIEPKFKSSVVIFPASTSSVSKALLTDMSRAPKDILKFGEEEETEQLMQVLHSDDIKAKIIAKYDLMKHYDISENSSYKKTKLLNQYIKNISFRKTEFQAIEISVLDKNPEYAANIANDITSLLDSVYNNIQKERAFEALQIIENEYFSQHKYIKTLEDSLTKLRNLGVFDYDSQAKTYNEAYIKAIENGNISKANLIKNELKTIANYGSAYNSLIKEHEQEIKQLSLLKSKYDEAKVDANQNLPHKYIVNPAQISEKKAYPIRWLIVVISTISAFVFSLFFALIYDNFSQIKKEISEDKVKTDLKE
ncbi:MAG: hypothetical protein JXR51_01370 [Bacteroidales bacterium]|nr:hypothetical protein [Bacteroidales bacterium]